MLNTLHMRNILLFFNSIFCNLIFAQKYQIYEGDYILNNKLSGKANFQFIVQKGDTILEGDFKFDKIRKDTLEKDEI